MKKNLTGIDKMKIMHLLVYTNIDCEKRGRLNVLKQSEKQRVGMDTIIWDSTQNS